MKSVAIIPARGGSKRISRKNIKLFLGEPIISYSIRAAIDSRLFDTVIVSTDDDEIAQIAIKCGASVPFRRSPENSDDTTGLAEVLIEVVKKLDTNYNIICCLLPTAPFVNPLKLIKAHTKLVNSSAKAIVPVMQYSYPIQRSLQITNQDVLKMNWPENYTKRSQDLAPSYHDVGQFYFIDTDTLLAEESLFPTNSQAIIIAETEAQDIDTEDDWIIAEMKYELLKRKEGSKI